MARAPEVVHIAITFADGTLGAMQFVVAQWRGANDTEPTWTREPTPENIEAEIRKMAEPDPDTGFVGLGAERMPIKGWRFCSPDEFPQDRTFRDAWRDIGTSIAVDMPKARNIHRSYLRMAREPLLAALDVEYQRADEVNTDGSAKPDRSRRLAEIVARKQKLRDAPADPRIEAAQTVDELKALSLDALAG